MNNEIITLIITICVSMLTAWTIIKLSYEYLEKKHFNKMKDLIDTRELRAEKRHKAVCNGYEILDEQQNEY